MKIPQSFFEEETRENYKVSSKMKHVWAVELDLLNEFIRICTKYNLTYYVMGGTLLGTVRHNGFIPWDDDIDVIMPRRDYNCLLEVGANEFKFPYFFQTPHTEKNFFRSHIQIRNSETTGSIKSDLNRNINKGIFIDVFVLDEVSDDQKEVKQHRRILNRISSTAIWFSDFKIRKFRIRESIKFFLKMLLIKARYGFRSDFFSVFNLELQKYGGMGNSRLAHATLSYRDGVIWDKKDWEEVIYMDFEMLKVAVPKGYDSILRSQYGDYLIIPDNKNGTAHGEVFFDPFNSYKKYFKVY